MGGLALVLLLLVGCNGQEDVPGIALAPDISGSSGYDIMISPAIAPAPLQEDLEGISDELRCEDRNGTVVMLNKTGDVLLLAGELLCDAQITLFQKEKKIVRFDMSQTIDFEILFYTREDEGHSQMFVKPFLTDGEMLYDSSRLLAAGRNRKEGKIQHALATRQYLNAVGKEDGVLELELLTHDPEAKVTLEIETLRSAPKLMKKQAEAAYNLMLECCIEGGVCAEAVAGLAEKLEEVGDLGPEELVDAEVCRSPVAICRDGTVKAWLLDLQVASCDLGKMLQPFKESLVSLSCYRCSFGENNDVEALALSFEDFDNLHDVHLMEASLSGRITCDWVYLQNLRVLDLDDNPSIIGNLPTCFNQEDFGLLSLSLEGCALEGGIQAIPNIRHLYIGRNAFKGKLDDFVAKNANADRMLTLHARGNSFSGTLPRLPRSIRSFDVGLNNFEGEVPEEYSRLEFLTNLQLDQNGLNGTLPDLPPSMIILNVSNNSFSGVLPDSYSKFTDLRYFYVGNNRLTGSLPKALPGTLLLLDVSGNGFTGQVPASYSNLPEVQLMAFFNNNLEGPLPAKLFKNKPDLTVVLFNNNTKLSGPLPTVWQAPRLQIVQMAGCALAGSIPKGLGALPVLKDLVLSGNVLEGTLDDFAEGLAEAGSQLQTCLLNDNEITGGIPDGFNTSMSVRLISPATLQRVPKRFDFNSNPMDQPIPEFVLDAVLDASIGGGFVQVSTQGTDMECPAADELPGLPSTEQSQRIILGLASLLQCVRDGEQLAVDDIYLEKFGGTPSDDDITNTLAPGPILEAGDAPTIPIAVPPPPPTDQLGFPPSLSAESTSDPDLDSRSIDIDSQAGETGEVVEGEGDSGEAGDKKSGGGTDGGVVAAAVLVPLTIIVLAVGGYICFRRSGSRFQRFEAGS